VLLALQIPPVAGELLARGLDEVTRGTRHDAARYRALDVHAHGRSLRAPLFDGSKNVCYHYSATQPNHLDRLLAARTTSHFSIPYTSTLNVPATALGRPFLPPEGCSDPAPNLALAR